MKKELFAQQKPSIHRRNNCRNCHIPFEKLYEGQPDSIIEIYKNSSICHKCSQKLRKQAQIKKNLWNMMEKRMALIQEENIQLSKYYRNNDNGNK